MILTRSSSRSSRQRRQRSRLPMACLLSCHPLEPRRRPLKSPCRQSCTQLICRTMFRNMSGLPSRRPVAVQSRQLHRYRHLPLACQPLSLKTIKAQFNMLTMHLLVPTASRKQMAMGMAHPAGELPVTLTARDLNELITLAQLFSAAIVRGSICERPIPPSIRRIKRSSLA